MYIYIIYTTSIQHDSILAMTSTPGQRLERLELTIQHRKIMRIAPLVDALKASLVKSQCLATTYIKLQGRSFSMMRCSWKVAKWPNAKHLEFSSTMGPCIFYPSFFSDSPRASLVEASRLRRTWEDADGWVMLKENPNSNGAGKWIEAAKSDANHMNFGHFTTKQF